MNYMPGYTAMMGREDYRNFSGRNDWRCAKSVLCLCLLLLQSSVVLGWNEPDSLMGIKFFSPIAEGTMKECSEGELAWPHDSKDLSLNCRSLLARLRSGD
jgi:hypothetical protein